MLDEKTWRLTRPGQIALRVRKFESTIITQTTRFLAENGYDVARLPHVKSSDSRQIWLPTSQALYELGGGNVALAEFRGLLNLLAECGSDREGECDFVEKVAAPLPIAVIAWLLGVPREDWDLLYDWTNRIIGAGDPDFAVEGEDANQSANAAIIETFTYFGQLIDEKMKNPDDDLISHLASAEVDGVKLDRNDLLGFCALIMAAGNETTRNATTGGMLALIENPEQLRRLKSEPDLLDSAIEEVVRWTSPVIHFARTAAQDCEIRGQKIKEGDALGLFYPSANRDEDVFEAPNSFRIDRKPNRHIVFGIGEHFCAGAHVARLEIRMAYQYLLPRIEEIELVGPPARLQSTFVGGIKRLPIRFKVAQC